MADRCGDGRTFRSDAMKIKVTGTKPPNGTLRDLFMPGEKCFRIFFSIWMVCKFLQIIQNMSISKTITPPFKYDPK